MVLETDSATMLRLDSKVDIAVPTVAADAAVVVDVAATAELTAPHARPGRNNVFRLTWHHQRGRG